MDNSATSNLKDPEILKQIWRIGNKHLVVIDESIIIKLGINDDYQTTFLEQQLTDDGILMRIKQFSTQKKGGIKE